MTNTELVRNYLAVATPGRLRLDEVRSFLADDVSIEDPMMSVEGADAFVALLAQTGGDGSGQMTSTVQDVIGDGDTVAARVLFEAGGIPIQFSQWFWIVDGRIARIEVVYDTGPFAELAAQQGTGQSTTSKST